MMNRFFYQILTLLLLVSSSAYAQEFRVNGNVISSEDHLPLIGATVVIKNTGIGTVTDIDGNFNLSIPKPGTTLTISFVGMATKEVVVNSSKSLDVILDQDSKLLGDIVVTALGIKRSEKALGYAQQAVTGETLQKVKGGEVATALSGKVAGLMVKNSSDFAAKPELVLRGVEALLVVDGVPYNNKQLSDISSEDIESISVLKGATASALYGNRGAGGAIIVTTKNGSSNVEGLTVELSTNTMFTAGYIALPKKQSIYGRGSQGDYIQDSSDSWGPKMEGQMLQQWDPFEKRNRVYEYLPIGKDNFKNFLQQGYVTNNNVSVSYKNKNAVLRNSLNWTQNTGQYPNQKLDKFTYTFGGAVDLNKLKINSNVSYARRHSPNAGSNGYTSYDPMYVLLVRTASDFNILDYKNNYWLEKDLVQNFTYDKEQNNPYFDAYERSTELTRDIFNTDLTVSYDFTNWMKLTARSGVDFFIDRGRQRVSMGSYVSTGNTNIPGPSWTWNGATDGAYNTGQNQGFSMNNDLMLTGDKTFGKFSVEYLAGGGTVYNKDQSLYSMTQGGLSIPGYFSLDASILKHRTGEEVKGRQVNSLYGRAAFSWDRLIFAEITGRNDWSSTMKTTSSPSYFYPSFAGSFVVSELMPQTKEWLDMLKARASWTVSKKPLNIFESSSVYNVGTAWNTISGASAPSSIYDPNLRPETDATFEIGTQGIFFKNRLMFDIAYYERKTYDILMSGDNKAPISDASGYTSMVVNADEARTTKGWEIVLNVTPIKSIDWQWDLAFNWTTYATYWTKIDSRFSDLDNPYKQVGDRVDHYTSGQAFLYDPSGNLIIGPDGLPIEGGYQSSYGWKDPNHVWGVNSTLRYKNFSLYASIDGVIGGLMGSRTESYMWQSGVHPNSVDDARLAGKTFIVPGVKLDQGNAAFDSYGRLIGEDTRTYLPNDYVTTYQEYIKTIHGTSAWGGNGTVYDIYSKTFFKFRELSLTYDIPKSFLSKCKLKGASVSFVGQNLMLWAKDFKYSDPDGQLEDFADPAVRYLGGNIKLTF